VKDTRHSINSIPLSLLAALAISLTACGGSNDPVAVAADTGSVAADTGSVAADTGSVAADTGSVAADTGSVAVDTGLVAPDTGITTEDTGTTPTDTGTSTGTNVPGKVVHKEMVDGVVREFIVYVPEKAKGSTKVPVVFIVHGTSQDGEHFYSESKWKEKADVEGMITVFPTALSYCYKEDENADGDFVDPGERRVTTKWNAGQFDPAKMPLCTAAEIAALEPGTRARADHPLQDDVAYFKFLLDFLGKKYAYDAKRVYATGFSNGAQMAARLGNDLPDRFAAVAAHAGPMAVTPVPAAKPITFLFSVGSVDDRFTAPGTPIPIAESTGTLPAFKRITDDFLIAGQMQPTYVYDEPKAGMKKMSRFHYAASKVGATNSVTTVVIEGCFHQYPNGINHPLVMANALWDLFKTRTVP